MFSALNMAIWATITVPPFSAAQIRSSIAICQCSRSASAGTLADSHSEMDMSVTGGGTLWQRISSEQGLPAISHYFVMDWASVWM